MRTRHLIKADLKVGANVICVYESHRGKIGRIAAIDHLGYIVRDKVGTIIGGSPWSSLSSWQIIMWERDPNNPLKCKGCDIPFPDSEPNQKDEVSFICYGCRLVM